MVTCMKMTIENISQVLDVPSSLLNKIIDELNIKPDENQLLSKKDIQKLRPALLRFYQRNRKLSSEKIAEGGACSSVDSIEMESSLDTIPEREDYFDARSYSNKKPIKEQSQNETITSGEKLLKCNNHNDQARTLLGQLIVNHIIMLDTCSIMHEGCESLIDSMIPLLRKYNKKIVIPNKVIEELKKHFDCWNDPVKKSLAEKGLQLCKRLKQENCLSIRGGQFDNFADNVFFVHFSILRFRYNMVLITQDYKLSQDILQLNNMQTGTGNLIRVFKLSREGALIEITE